VTRKGNSSVTATRTKSFLVTAVLRLVYENITSGILRTPLRGDGRTSAALSEAAVSQRAWFRAFQINKTS
jgi:hypothetical protein